ncbi:methylthioribulose-1-phosphate dehydratase [Kitasatospora sp. MAP12-15]|uniref:methylthioribulose 1-phosphate dehydratase n=1 Tax=unclassified Kitasatospora TaxID=2633591 RepID=UPI002475CA85|nr:methylthioribulose 1-phosphate dehydratase [Kitasatospora sp. MAP12-44]MDH6113708.1 methylthioribulose-1-phosphate dehydratase [Kitasatospora sp. MAP12-44]
MSVTNVDLWWDPSDSSDAPSAASGADCSRPAAELAAFSRALYARGWMPGTSGNLSVRLPGSEPLALITASGRDKGELTIADTVLIDAHSARPSLPSLPGGPRASAEASIHAAVYRSTDAGAVIHVHAPYTTWAACRTGARSGSGSGTGALTLAGFELLKGLDLADPSRTELPVFANWPDVPRIAQEIAAHLAAHPQAPPGLLIADHGVTTWGRDLAEARNRLECLEAICRLLQLGVDAVPTERPVG